MTKTCPRCHLPQLPDNEAEAALSHDGKTYICSECGLIESYEAMGLADKAWGLKTGQRRAQAAMYGLDNNGTPKLPKESEKK